VSRVRRSYTPTDTSGEPKKAEKTRGKREFAALATSREDLLVDYSDFRKGESSFVLSQATPENLEALRQWDKAGEALAALRFWADEHGHRDVLAGLDEAMPGLTRMQSALVGVGR
jgi:hypothetical protein